MNRTKSQLKEADEIYKFTKKYFPKEDRKAFLKEQREAAAKTLYRFWTDVEVGKRYISHGDKIGEEAYHNTGETKIQEAVQNMRSLRLVLEKYDQLIKDLDNE